MTPRSPPGLMEIEELVEELLLRFPPDDPASLVRAALVNKRWCRLICGRRFRRLFRKFHGTPPLLGFFRRCVDPSVAERSSSFHLRDDADRSCLRAVHSCHGRVLMQSGDPTITGVYAEGLFVWEPVTDKLRELPSCPLNTLCCQWNGAVLCASEVASTAAGGCDHLDCIDGPFMVVFVGYLMFAKTFICVYSSEDDSWSKPKPVDVPNYFRFDEGSVVLLGNAVYFMCRSVNPKDGHGPAILKYDLLTLEPSPVHVPRVVGMLEQIHDDDNAPVHFSSFVQKNNASVLMATEDGRLGFAFIPFTSTKPKLYLYSMEHGPDGYAGCWAQSRVMDLDMLLQTSISRSARVVAFADTGAGGVLFIWTGDGLFSFDLKSGTSKALRGSFGDGRVVPYMGFCTPALGAVSALGDDEPSA